jgi:uncharacterized protein (DUF169 family)
MEKPNYPETAEFIRNDLRLKTMPIAVKFLKDETGFPDKTRRPSSALGKKVTICQAVTMARVYGWTMGLTKEDLICAPAAVAFGLSGAKDPAASLAGLFCEVAFHSGEKAAVTEIESMVRLSNEEYGALLLAPLARTAVDPDTVAIYANPAQVMRLVQAWVYWSGKRVPGHYGGKLECCEYLIAPFKTGAPRVAIPGMGDRIFSMTQDDEMVFGLPGQGLDALVQGLREAGSKIGARYPVTFYQNFQPEFPKPHKALGAKLGIG